MPTMLYLGKLHLNRSTSMSSAVNAALT